MNDSVINSVFDTSKFILANNPLYDIDRYRKQNVGFFTIEGVFEAKITYPRIHGIGLTGIYVDSIRHVNGSEVLQFNLYAKNLVVHKEEMLKKAIRTIRFKPPR